MTPKPMTREDRERYVLVAAEAYYKGIYLFTQKPDVFAEINTRDNLVRATEAVIAAYAQLQPGDLLDDLRDPF